MQKKEQNLLNKKTLENDKKNKHPKKKKNL